MIRTVTVVTALAGAIALSPQSQAQTGSLLVPGDITPGNYWATPEGSMGGYVEVCADYTCDIGGGLIRNYSVDGRTMVVISSNATLVNVARVNLTPVGAGSSTAPSGASGTLASVCDQIDTLMYGNPDGNPALTARQLEAIKAQIGTPDAQLLENLASAYTAIAANPTNTDAQNRVSTSARALGAGCGSVRLTV